MTKLNLFFRLFIVAFTMGFAVACQQGTGRQASSGTNKNTEWKDSAEKLLIAVETLYNNDLHDSLMKMAPEAMDFMREHRVWDVYYLVWHHVADDHVWYNEFAEAAREAEAMQKDAVERKDSFGLSLSYMAEGTGYLAQNNNEEARWCFNKAIDIFPQKGRKGTLMQAYDYYADCLSSLKDYTALDSLMTVWRNFLNQYGDPDSKKATAQWYYQYFSDLMKYQIAVDSLQQAAVALDSLVYYAQLKGVTHTHRFNIAVGRYQLAMARGNYTEALNYANEQLKLSQEDHGYRQLSLTNRANVLEKMGQYREALADQRAYVLLHDSLTQATNREQLNHLNKRYQLNELKSENDLLQQRSRFTTGGVAMILGVVALLAFLSFNSRWTRRIEIKNQQLQRERNVVVKQNKQLALERDRAEAASKAKTAFIHSMTHEIRTPLNAISGFTQVLTMDDAAITPEVRADMSQRIMDGTRMLTNILDDLILISDFESRTEQPALDDCLIMYVADQAIEAVRPLMSEGVTIENKAQVSPELVVKTDAMVIQNVLVKLLENAAQFTTQGHITLTTTFANGKLHFAVSDTGPGIPADKHEYVFERFAKIDSFSQGAGLGLTIARMLAEYLGGSVTIDADYRDGAKLDVVIPIENYASAS